MNKKQATIQELQQEKQDVLKKSKIYKTISTIANYSAGAAAVFILIGATKDDIEMTLSAMLICMSFAIIGAASAYDGKKYTETASKFQRKINRIQGRQK